MMPWLGLFNKIYKADLWVVLDHTLNNPRDATFWGRRVKILVNGEGKWLSLPLKRPDKKGIVGIPISEMEFNNDNPRIFQDALKTVEFNYKRSPYFNEVYPFVENYLLSDEQKMSNRNFSFIFQVMEHLEIKTRVSFSSNLNCKLNGTQLLIEILKKERGSTYLCGAGASSYQQDELFAKEGIELEYNNYNHPTYKQNGSKIFVPGLSIIDAAMNIGWKETKKLIQISK